MGNAGLEALGPVNVAEQDQGVRAEFHEVTHAAPFGSSAAR
jgi:hypothetical protein